MSLFHEEKRPGLDWWANFGVSVVGITCILWGAYQIYPPAAWIIGGCFGLIAVIKP